jgi:hypothetical protein
VREAGPEGERRKDEIQRALRAALARYRQPDGSIVLESSSRAITARNPAGSRDERRELWCACTPRRALSAEVTLTPAQVASFAREVGDDNPASRPRHAARRFGRLIASGPHDGAAARADRRALFEARSAFSA